MQIMGRQLVAYKSLELRTAEQPWAEQSSGTSDYLTSVSFTDANNGTVVGLGGIILRTTDGGVIWNLQSKNPGLFDVSFTDSNKGTAVGMNGTILRTTNGGVTFIGDENGKAKPQEYILAQNYPNPFNPTTRIKFSIPQIGLVTIKVYNLLGNLVTTLVNQDKPAGNYEVEFNGAGLSSGVYFYTLQSGSFREIKKFILIK
ncbi:MAG: T9SS type A sorting domain-containing protein [Ignavibacteriales bacterium]|nr:T9SS type A sorting domain-containing protein [Ignavibacteriales bacterium]